MEDAVTALRAFNRFYTRFVDALGPHYLGSSLSLPEARLLYEVASRQSTTASEIQGALGLDAGYVSRMLRGLQARGLIQRSRGADARQRPITLTDAGADVFRDLDDRTRAQVARTVDRLGETDQLALVDALGTVEALLGQGQAADWRIRTYRPGDMGMVTARQAILYAEQHGWGTLMEAYIADVTARFLKDFKPGREQCWIAERGGAMIGSVFLVDAGDGVAQLRLLYVEPSARGLGVGRELVDRCVVLAREAGYEKLMLWTHTVLTSARRIYAAAGFNITSVEMHSTFGEPEQGEMWELSL